MWTKSSARKYPPKQCLKVNRLTSTIAPNARAVKSLELLSIGSALLVSLEIWGVTFMARAIIVFAVGIGG